jgi:NAD(P)-dependent dehydrogenase (short-subunit alcohol dehydrogenase family)
MRKTGGGVIVNSGLTAGVVGFSRRSAYCAAKGGVVALTRALAIELAPHGIRINAILSGATDTVMVRAQYQLQADPAAAQRRHVEKQLIGRLSTVDDIAQAVVFLACDEASTMTGTALTVDGGYTAR